MLFMTTQFTRLRLFFCCDSMPHKSDRVTEKRTADILFFAFEDFLWETNTEKTKKKDVLCDRSV